MVSSRRIRRLLSTGTLGAAALFVAVPGQGADERPKGAKACGGSFKHGIAKEQAGELRAARDLFVTCARSICGKPIAHACTAKVEQLDSSDIPSILPHVVDESGAQRTDVKVRMDGELLTSRLDGRSILLDPGLHELSFSTENGLLFKQKLLIAEGQRDRPVEVDLHPGDPKELEAEKALPDTPGTPAPGAEAKKGEGEAGGEGAGADKGEAAVPLPKDPRACMAVFRSAEEKEQQGHMREARSLLVKCSRSACGHAMLQQCASKFTQIDSVDLPSIVPTVTDETGAVRTDVQVRMDGELLAARIDGQALAVDPGMHEFAFTTESGASATQKILIAEGQLARPIPVTLHGAEKAATPEKEVAQGKPKSDGQGAQPPEVPEPPTVENKRSAAPYIVGGTVLAAVEVGAFALYLSKGDTSHLAADAAIGVSAGLGAAALGVATWLFLRHPSTGETPAPQSGYVFDVAPTPSGAYASVRHAF